MLVEALKNFTGVLAMAKGEIKDIDPAEAAPLLKVNYVKKVRKTTHENKNNESADA